jgi:hypothetical protein
MSNKIILKKSSIASKVPTTLDLDYGELALNYTDGKLFFKTASNTIEAFSSGNSPSSPDSSIYTSSIVLEDNSDNQIIDTFASDLYRSAKYFIQTVNDSGIHTAEVLLMHDDDTVFLSQTNNLFTSNILFTINAIIESGNVYLRMSPTDNNTVVDFTRTSLISRPFFGVGDLMTLSGVDDLMLSTGTADLNA